MIPAPRNDKSTANKQIASVIFGIVAALGAAYVLLKASFEAYDYFIIGHESLRNLLLKEISYLIFAGFLFFETFQFVKYFAKKPPTHDS